MNTIIIAKAVLIIKDDAAIGTRHMHFSSTGKSLRRKVLFSTEKINNQEALKANLDLNNKEVLSALKRTNHLLLLDTWETMI